MDREVCKFDINELLPIGLTIVALGVAITYGLSVQTDLMDDQCEYGANDLGLCLNASGSPDTNAPWSAEANATSQAIGAVSKIPSKLGLIVTVIVAAVIIGILVRYLMVRYA